MNWKVYYLVFVALLVTSYSNSQSNLLNAIEVDQIGKQSKEKIAADNDTPLSYGYIDDRDILWSKVVWEFVDLNQKINLPYYYPIDTANISNDRRSLFDTLLKGIRKGDIKNVYSDSFFTSKITGSEINEKLAAGEAFEALAKEYSEDVGSADFGGDLGYTSGDTFPESFETALEALQVGEVSPPVSTDSGIHLIKLLDIQEKIVDFDSERARIEQELVTELTDVWLVEKLANLKELSYNAENLAEIATDLELTAQISEPFTRAGGAGISANPAVYKAAFSSQVLEDSYASDVLELGDDRYVVLKLNKSIPARQKALSEVRGAVVASLTDQLARANLATRGAELLARVDSGEDIETVAKAEDLEWQVVLDAKRSTGGTNNEIKRFAFQLPATATEDLIESFYARSGDFVVLALTSVEAGDSSKLSEDQKASLSYAGVSSTGGRELQAVQKSLRDNADVAL